MRKWKQSAALGCFLVLIAVLGASCGTQQQATPTPAEGSGLAGYDEALQAARANNEGLVISHFTDAPIAQILERFTNETGIRVEATAARPSQVIPQMLLEQQNGQFNWDILMHPVSNIYEVLKPIGGLEPILPYVVRPDVADDSLWYGGLRGGVEEEPLFTIFDGIRFDPIAIVVNRDEVPESELNSWEDLLKPQWKGKFGAEWQQRPHNTSIVLACIAPTFESEQAWEDFVRGVFAQEFEPAGDFRTPQDWLVQGRHNVIVHSFDDRLRSLIRELNLNVELVGADRNRCMGSPGGTSREVSVPKNPPNPNAAKVFINWLLTQEVQQMAVELYTAEGLSNMSRRRDVQHPNPDFQRDAIAALEDQWLAGAKEVDVLQQNVGRHLELQSRVFEIAREAGY